MITQCELFLRRTAFFFYLGLFDLALFAGAPRRGLVCLLTCLLIFFNQNLEAEVYLSKDEALDLVFQNLDCKVEPDFRILNEGIKERLSTLSLSPEPDSSKAHFFKCVSKEEKSSVLAYALIDQEVGKHLPITYVVGFSPEGAVTIVEMMIFREVRGWEVREKTFMKQFQGRDSLEWNLNNGISHVTGATLSSIAMVKGVKRALVLWKYFYNNS